MDALFFAFPIVTTLGEYVGCGVTQVNWTDHVCVFCRRPGSGAVPNIPDRPSVPSRPQWIEKTNRV